MEESSGGDHTPKAKIGANATLQRSDGPPAAPGFIFACVSLILNRLKQAEAERERLVAERKRAEAEADAALAAYEREQALQPRAAVMQQAPAAGKAAKTRAAPPAATAIPALVLAGLAAAAGFSAALLITDSPAPTPPAPIAPAPPAAPAFNSELRLDRDAEGFAARAKEKEPQ